MIRSRLGLDLGQGAVALPQVGVTPVLEQAGGGHLRLVGLGVCYLGLMLARSWGRRWLLGRVFDGRLLLEKFAELGVELSEWIGRRVGAKHRRPPAHFSRDGSRRRVVGIRKVDLQR